MGICGRERKKGIRYDIEVRKYPETQPFDAINGFKYEVIKKVRRTMWCEQIVNFNPLFCRFNNKVYVVQSDDGDISDPFRRETVWLSHLYIEINKGVDYEEIRYRGKEIPRDSTVRRY